MLPIQVGDTVLVECVSGHGTGGKDTVTAIRTRYFVYTGKPYTVICVGDHEFDAVSGNAVTPPYAYYIVPIKEGK
jgi:hypothetical protein